MLLRDNVYGESIEEDASRRDYTINALYYSPIENKIHDFHGGVYDIINGNIDIIGNPEKRFREDPVRMIRAYRFAAKLGFKITERTLKPMPELLDLLKEVPAARMFDEFNKMFITGHGEKSFNLLYKNDILKYLLTDLGPLLKDESVRDFIAIGLRNSDTRHAEGKRNMPHFLFAVMLWPLLYKLYTRMLTKPKYAAQNNDSIIKAAASMVIQKQNMITMLPQTSTQDITNIWKLVIELENPDNLEQAEKFVWNPLYRAAQDFLLLRGKQDQALNELYEKWLNAYEFIVPPSLRSRASLEKAKKDKDGSNSKQSKVRKTKNDRNSKKFTKSFRRQKPSKRAAEAEFFK
jgi:poly(A) polymerase